MPDDEVLDPQAAAALMQQTRQHTSDALRIKLPWVYAAWGVAWLVGLGAMWLSVQSRHLYHGPSTTSAVLLGILIVAAIAVTMVVVIRATKGVQGTSEMQGRLYGLSWPIGFAALFAIEGSLASHGASDAVMGLIGAAGPLLITAVIYLVASAMWLDRSMFALGAWLAVVTGVAVQTGPVTVLLIEALAGGGGLLVAAAVLSRRYTP
jgi:hypothetical protein